MPGELQIEEFSTRTTINSSSSTITRGHARIHKITAGWIRVPGVIIPIAASIARASIVVGYGDIIYPGSRGALGNVDWQLRVTRYLPRRIGICAAVGITRLQVVATT